MIGTPTIAAALLLGLAASGHCVLMCGGISGALALATKRGANGRPRPHLLVAYQFGRIGGYALAGLAFGTLGALLYGALDQTRVRLVLRILAAAAFVAAAFALSGGHGVAERFVGTRLWMRLAPRARALFPVDRVSKALAFGLIWGWMPCGFVYTVLLLAWSSFSPWTSAATMVAFGLGTLPSMLAAAFGGSLLPRLLQRTALRRGVAAALLTMAGLTLAGPWLAHLGVPVALLPFDCATGAH